MKILSHIFGLIFILIISESLLFLIFEYDWIVNTFKSERLIAIAVAISVIIGFLICKSFASTWKETENIWTIRFCIFLFFMSGGVALSSYLNRTFKEDSYFIEQVLIVNKKFKEEVYKSRAEWKIVISYDGNNEEILVSKNMWNDLVDKKYATLKINNGAFGFHFIQPPKYYDGIAN